MQFTTTILASLLSATAFALLATTPVTPCKPVIWSISHFRTGYSLGGCVYNSNIASYGDQTPFPNFSTSCEGTKVQNAYKACADSHIQGNMKSTTDGWTLFVERLYPETTDETALIASNVTFPLIEGDQEQGAEISYSCS